MKNNNLKIAIYSLINEPVIFDNVEYCTMQTKSGVIQVFKGHESMVTVIDGGFLKIKQFGKKLHILDPITGFVKIKSDKIEIYKVVT